MRITRRWFLCMMGWLLYPAMGHAAPTAEEIITLARQQLTMPAEFVWGEMKVFRGDALHRSCSFVMGKAWEPETQTEYVRIDFKTAVNTAVESSLYTDQRYLLKRTSQGPATQWLYLPALRRVRIVPYQPDDPVLQSQQLFYDLTTIQNLTDYHYHFVDTNEQTPVIGAVPLDRGFPVPYEKVVFQLERRGNTYIVTALTMTARGKEKRAELSQFAQIASDHYRPQRLVITGESGRTEFLFHDWSVGTLNPQLIAPSQLETQTLAMPVSEARE